MSLEFSGQLFSGNQRNGSSLLVGIGQSDRYSPLRASDLLSAGLGIISLTYHATIPIFGENTEMVWLCRERKSTFAIRSSITMRPRGFT